MRSAALALALVLLPCAPASADDRARCTEELSDDEVTRRLAIVSRAIHEEEPGVRRWFSSFAALHGSMAAGAALLAAFADDEGFRNEMLVGTTSSTLALISLVVVLPPMLGAGDQLDSIDADDPAGRRARLRFAEDLLRRDAASIDFLHSWFPITLTSLYVVAASTFNLAVLERTTGAFTHSVGGAILGLGRVLLRPTGSRSRWHAYRRAFPDAGCEPTAYRAPSPRLRLVVAGAGLGLRLSF